MPTFFVDTLAGDLACLSPEDAHHARAALRMKEGEALQIACAGRRYEAVLQQGEAGLCARIISPLPDSEAHTRVTLYQGWPKGDKLDLIVRQATELGVHAIVPVLFARCVARPEGSKRLERLNRIAREAAMQSGRGLVPVVEPPISVQALYHRLKTHELALVPYELETSTSLRQAVQPVKDIGLVIGPEGGLTQEEVAQMPALPVSLGPRILRTETAGVAALAMLLALLEEA